MPGAWNAAVLALAVPATLIAAPARAADASGPAVRPDRIVLVTVDGLAGERAAMPHTPALAGLIARGVHTTGAITPSLGSYPATAALLAGRVAPAESAGARRDAEPRGLAAALGRLGYRGLALAADPLTHARSGVESGFARFAPSSPALHDSVRVDSALAWLARPGKRFVWLGLTFGEGQPPWRRDDGPWFAATEDRDRRAAEIDAALARLLAGMERAALTRRTMIAVVGTHGLASDSNPLRVPMVFVHSGGAGPIAGEAHLLDVAPTLVAGAGGVVSGFAGRPLLGGTKAPRDPVPPSPDPGSSPCRAGLDSLIHAADPRPDSAAIARLVLLAERCPDDARVAIEAADGVSRAGREAEAARRFLALRATWPDDAGGALAYAHHLLRHRRFAMVANALAAIPRTSPLAGEAAWLEVGALAGELRFAEAARAAREAAAVVAPAAAHLGIPAALERLRDAQQEAENRKGDVKIRLEYGRLLGQYGLVEEAYRNLHRARAADTTSAEADFWIAVFLMRDGRFEHAEAALVRGLGREPGHRAARATLAEVLVRLDRWKEAVPHLERVVAGDSADAQSRYNLACLLARDGRTRDALEALKRSVAAGYANFEGMRSDPDLVALRDLPEFRALLPPRR